MMRILQVIPFFTPARGGSVIVPYHLLRELCKKGHDVTLITTDYEFNERFAGSLYGVDIISFKCLANFGLFLYSPEMKQWLRDNIKNYDVIHMHNFRSYQNNIVHHYSMKYHIPYVLQPHGSIPIIIQKQSLKKLYDFVWGNSILRDAKVVIAVTNEEAEQCNQIGVNWNRIHVMPNGVDLSEYTNLPIKGKFKKKYGIKDHEKVILYLGRLHKIKGIGLLVSAFADLAKDYNNFRLVIAGPDDGFLPSLKEQIDVLKTNDKVLITGQLDGSDKIEAYCDADVYVLPSVYEIFGITILEACACGTPVVVTDRCGIANIVDNNVGYVVGYDKDQLREAIVKILIDEDLKKRYGVCGKRLVTEEFNWNRIVSNIEDLYETIMAR